MLITWGYVNVVGGNMKLVDVKINNKQWYTGKNSTDIQLCILWEIASSHSGLFYI